MPQNCIADAKYISFDLSPPMNDCIKESEICNKVSCYSYLCDAYVLVWRHVDIGKPNRDAKQTVAVFSRAVF